MTIRIGQSQVHASGRGLDDAVGNSSEVRRELNEGIGSLLGWCKGVCHKKTKTHRKIIGGSRKACREIKLRHRSNDWTIQRELAGSSLGDSPKGSGSSQATHGRSLKEGRETHHCRIQRLLDCGSEVISLVVMFDCNL
ncbi:hypothetical protein BHM03_00062575 [Ensete ventricosum]|nr:hypothetical protein BHM03_00062575 [Ensete ventricosum]